MDLTITKSQIEDSSLIDQKVEASSRIKTLRIPTET